MHLKRYALASLMVPCLLLTAMMTSYSLDLWINPSFNPLLLVTVQQQRSTSIKSCLPISTPGIENMERLIPSASPLLCPTHHKGRKQCGKQYIELEYHSTSSRAPCFHLYPFLLWFFKIGSYLPGWPWTRDPKAQSVNCYDRWMPPHPALVSILYSVYAYDLNA